MFKLTEVLVVLCLFFAHTGSQQCDRASYRCDGKCVKPCDGFLDCSDGADETTSVCSTNTCSSDNSGGDLGDLGGLLGEASTIANQRFRCNYGGCIGINFKCNGRAHCWDGSDETADICREHKCKRLETKCKYGGCIRRLWRCDGKPDCIDGSDETAEVCRSISCPSRKPFRCSYGACIEENKKCNGVADCVDHSDEAVALCGAGHTFTLKSDRVKIPEAETNPAKPTTAPTLPPTQPPTPPPTPPPTVPTPPSDPCAAALQCTCPGNGICVPCDRLGLCSSLIHGPKCSLPPDGDHGITVNVLACGNQALVNVAAFSRNHNTLCSSDKVPADSVVVADCWGTATILAQCHADGKWHPYGNHLEQNTMEPMQELCQPQSVNSLICGRRPRYRRLQLPSNRNQQQWPWLATVYRNHSYACTGTVISRDYILTAGHCITESEESTKVVAVRWLIVQFVVPNGDIGSSSVTEVYIYPNYTAGTQPTNDVALIKVARPIVFSHKVVPACISTGAFPPYKIAATFDHSDPEAGNSWRTVLQTHDPRCHIQLDRCHTHEIDDDQFCAIDINRVEFLEKGSSGGPYLANMGTDVKEQWTVAGIVSAAAGILQCKQPYTIYTRVSNFSSWIENCSQKEDKARYCNQP